LSHVHRGAYDSSVHPSLPPSFAQRVILAVARLLLSPVARVRPDSAWARLHGRLCALEHDQDSRDDRAAHRPQRQPERPSPVPIAAFTALIVLALGIWIWDVVRRPPPEPARAAPTCGNLR
jgi:hypothetical protein